MAHSGKTMTFATDLVPQEDNIYNLGYDNQRWKIYGDLQPLATKIYNAPLYNTSSGANFYQNFATVIPVDYNALWIAHYRITITAEGHSDYTEICDVSISGRANTYYTYKIYNSIVTYSIYQHMLLNSNSTSNNQHELGYRMQGSYGADSVAKVVKVELLEQLNCIVTLLDNLKLYTSATPSGYTWRGFNATSNGLQEAGDTNDIGYYILSNGFKGKAGSNKVYRYCLFARTGDGTYESFVMQDNTVATTKTVNPHGFVPDGKIYWNANNTVYSEGTLNLSPYQQYHALDYRYSFNFNNTFLPDYCETYVVYTYNEDDGLLYLDTTQWLAAALPTTADGKIYQRIGSKYYTGTSNYYQGSLLLENPYYEYKDGDIRSWSATHLSNITGADDLKAIEAISGTSGLLKKTAANTWTLDTNTYSPTSHNHNSTYLKLDGSNNMAADVNIIAGDTDKFVNFWYNTNKTAGASWRVGMLGSGSGNTNYFVIQSGTSTTSATAWNNALKIGQNNYDIYNNENRIPHTGNATGSVGGATTPVYVDAGVIKQGTALGNVAYINKPTSNTTTTFLRGDGTWQTALTSHQSLAAYAPLASPALTGTPTAPTAADGTSSTQIATTAFVMSQFQYNDAMIFKGTLAGATSTTYTPAANRGWTYKVSTAGLINGESVEVGDMLICTTDSTAAATSSNVNTVKANWVIVQNNVDGAIFKGTNGFTDTHVIIADGTNGKVKDSGFTIASSVPSNAKFTDTTSFTITANATDGLWNLTGTNGTNAVTYALAPYSSKGTTATFYTAATNPTLTTRLNYDGYLYATKLYSGGTEVSVSGHTHSYLSSISWSGDTNLKLKQSVNGATATDVLQFAAGSNITLTGASGKITIAGTPDTKNTAGSTNSDSKLYLIGATSQAANPQTYSDAHVFETNGAFSAKTLGVNADTDNNKVTLQWNATDSSLDFVFA